MRDIRNGLVLLVTFWLSTPVFADTEKRYLGSIVEITPPVELRESPDKKPFQLDAEKHLYSPVYRGYQVRCGARGRVKMTLLYGTAWETNATTWVDVPEVAPPTGQAVEVSGELSKSTVAAGRTRGTETEAPRASTSSTDAIPAAKPLPATVKILAAAGVLNLIYLGAPPSAPAPTATPRLQFGIEARRKGETSFSPLNDGDALASETDDYLVVARPLSAGFLYVFQVDAAGETQWLFPTNNTCQFSSGANPVSAGQVLQMPPAGKKAFYLDTNAGIEHLYVVFSAMRWSELEAALAKPARAPVSSVVMAGVVQESNKLQSRGIAGIHEGTVAMELTDALWPEGLYDGATNKMQVTGQTFDAAGRFLVIERWFRHVKSQ